MIIGLHILRGLAALMVAAFHMNAAAKAEEFDAGIFGLFRGGAVGVDIFFVLSGFIIYYVASRSQNWSPKQFMRGRFFRIYPMHWLSLIGALTLFYGLWFATGDASRIPTFHTIFASVFLLPVDTYVISIAWTLAVEMLFYILFAFTFKHGGRNDWLIAGLITWSAFSVLRSIFDFNFPGSTTLLNAAVPELLFGVVIAKLHLAGVSSFRLLALIFGIIATALHCIYYPVDTLEAWRPVIVGIPSAALVYGALGESILCALPDPHSILSHRRFCL